MSIMEDSRSSQYDAIDAGAPLPDYSSAGNIRLQTVAPALGVTTDTRPDYLDYDQRGRGIVVTMFANSGMSYLFGIAIGGGYGLHQGLRSTPSSKFKVQLNSILNHGGRHGSRLGNALGVFAIMYSLYEGYADRYNLEELVVGRYRDSIIPPALVSPSFAAFMTGATYFAPSGVRVAALAGTLGFGAVGATYMMYTILGIPYGSIGYLFL